MGKERLIIEVLRDGEYYMEDDAASLADHFNIAQNRISNRARVGGVITLASGKYLFRYNGKVLPRRIPEKLQEHPKYKPKVSTKDVVTAARQAGMSYGQYVARMGL